MIGPDATKFYRSKFPLFSANAIGLVATVLMAIVSIDFYFIYWIMRGHETASNKDRKLLAFVLTALTLTHILFVIMERSGAVKFRISEINRALFLMVSM